MFRKNLSRTIVAICGYIIILGNFYFLTVSGSTRLFEARGDLLAAIVVVAGIFFWGSGLMGIFLPLSDVDFEKGTPFEKKAAYLKASVAMNLGAVLAWGCLASREESLMHGHAYPGGSILGLLFFTTWSFTGAIGMALQLPKLPRFRLSIVRKR